MQVTREQLSETQSILLEANILAAFLHGSVAKECARPDSDIDIALLPSPGKSIPLRTRLELAGELEIIFGRPVDLGELTIHNLIYAKEVISTGQQIFTQNAFESDRFSATALAMYAELQQQRKEVLYAYSA